MASCSWLHLSDWHQRGIDFDRQVVRDKLIEDLQARRNIDPALLRIDFVVFSGDLAFRGLAEEFEAARSNLLDPVLDVLDLTPQHLFIVAGNHDLNRDTVYEMLPSELQKPIASDEIVQKWLTDAKRRIRVFEPFEAFSSFVSNLTNQTTPEYSNVKRFTVDGITIALLGINSAWMCARNKDVDREVNDYGFITIGEAQIHDKLALISDAEVRIAVMHHSYEWLQSFERNRIRDRIAQVCHFVLRGHEHEPDFNLIHGLTGECMLLPGGACYDRRQGSDPRYVNSYNFVNIDLSRREGMVCFRRWSERQTRWIEDVDLCSDGKHVFNLPKALGHLPVRQTTSIPSRPRLETDAINDKLVSEYRQHIVESYKTLSFKGLTASARPILLPLEKVYVQLRAVSEVPERADEFTPEERRLLRWVEDDEGPAIAKPEELREIQMQLDAFRRERWTKERLERFPIASALKDASRRGLVILGDPGSGKTTLLHFLALAFARGPESVASSLGFSGNEADRLPIFAPLAAYDDMLNHNANLSIRDFLPQYYEKRRALPGLARLFEEALESGRALILLDGMDEVLEESRRKFVAEQASAFIRTVTHHNNRVLLTSRIYGYRAAPLSVELPHVTVLDFRQEEIEIFARQWNVAMAEWEYIDHSDVERRALAEEDERSLLNELTSSPGVRRLAANPLLLSMLALLRRQIGRLPQQRIRLYSLYLGALIDAWEVNRSPGARVNAPIRLDSARAELVLIPLALWLQQNKPSGTATETQILAQITGVYLKEDGLPPDSLPVSPGWIDCHGRARKFLEDMRQFSGLIVERGRGAFGFRHLTFQEYYVGRALARMDAKSRWDFIRANIHANRWREPILLSAAQLGTMQADEEACTALVSNVLDAKSAHEEILRRDLFLAADCSADDINVDITVLRRIAEALKPLAVSPIPTVARDAIRCLARLAELNVTDKTRVPETIASLASAIPVDEQSALSLSEYVSLTSKLYGFHPSLLDGVKRKLNHQNVRLTAAAIEALAPLLKEDRALRKTIETKLNDEEAHIRAAAIEALAPLLKEDQALRDTIENKLNDKDSWVCQAAIKALAPFLKEDQPLRDTIENKLNDKEAWTRSAAIEVLAPFLKEDQPLRETIENKLNDEKVHIRAAAIEALAPLLKEDQALRKTIETKLNDEEAHIRAAAIEALAPLLKEDQTLRDTIREKLNDKDSRVRTSVIQTISTHGLFEDSLLELARHRDWQTRSELYQALAATHNDTVMIDIVSRGLYDLTCSESVRVGARAIKALAPLLKEDQTLRETIENKLNDEEAHIRAAAIEALAPLVQEDQALRKTIETKLNDEEAHIRAAAIEALAPLVQEDQALRKTIETKLNDEEAHIRAAAIKALTPLLKEDQTLRKTIETKLNDKDSWVCRAAIKALAPLLKEDRALRKTIETKLNDEEAWTRRAAIEALTPLLKEDQTLRKTIETKLNDKDSWVRQAAIEALTPLVQEDQALRKTIETKLNDKDYEVRSIASRALAPLLKEDQALRERIQEKVNDEHSEGRSAAIEAVAQLVKEDQSVFETIKGKLRDSEPLVRGAAIKTLGPLIRDNEALRQIIVNNLTDAEDWVRIQAIAALALNASKTVVQRELIPVLQSDDFYVTTPRSKYRMEHQTTYSSVFVAWNLAAAIANDPTLQAQVTQFLTSEDSRLRLSAVEILAHAGKNVVKETTRAILQVIDDHRGLDSWPARIVAAEILINHPNHCRSALDTLALALDYGAHPLVFLNAASFIRSQAAIALGKLKAEYYRPEIALKITSLLKTEKNTEVLDNLFQSLYSLASAPGYDDTNRSMSITFD